MEKRSVCRFPMLSEEEIVDLYQNRGKIMGQGTQALVKGLAQAALETLAQAAEGLLAGYVKKHPGVKLKVLAAQDNDPSTVIDQDTTEYCESNFAATFGYYYQGLRSQPTTGDLPVAATADIIVWDPAENGLSDIQTYLQNVFQDSIAPGDSIELANNLSQLFEERFSEESLQWTPFDKRYNFPDGLVVDCYMVTACGYDTDNNPAGVATYCFVAYNHTSA